MEYYQTIQGDTWDIIAKKVYGDEKHMDFLMAHNFPLLDQLVFSTGVQVKVPDLPENVSSDLPPWRQGV